MSGSLHVLNGEANTIKVGQGVIAEISSGKTALRAANSGELPYAIVISRELQSNNTTHDYSASQGGSTTIRDVTDIGLTNTHPVVGDPLYYSLSNAVMSTTQGTDGILCGHIYRLEWKYPRDYQELSIGYHFVGPMASGGVKYSVPTGGSTGDLVIVVKPARSEASIEVFKPDNSTLLLLDNTSKPAADVIYIFRKTATDWEVVDQNNEHIQLYQAGINFSILAIHQHVLNTTAEKTLLSTPYSWNTTGLKTISLDSGIDLDNFNWITISGWFGASNAHKQSFTTTISRSLILGLSSNTHQTTTIRLSIGGRHMYLSRNSAGTALYISPAAQERYGEISLITGK